MEPWEPSLTSLKQLRVTHETPMCGICGILNFDRDRSIHPSVVLQMMETLHHRGPDGGGHYISGPVGMGHRRLSIIDLDAGGQPMSNEDGMIWIVYNGEIYNFQALRRELLDRGHIFRSSSDTEVILHLYEEYGESCLSRLKGMFAFAIWDERKQSLLIARDRVGIKPLYYARNQDSILFASEIKALLSVATHSREVAPTAIDRFLTYYYLPGTETLFQGIKKLEPGHYLLISEGKVATRQYWDLRFPTSSRWRSLPEAVEALQGLLSRTVKEHMVSDVPLGVLLSGGVDSTGMLRHAAEHSTKPLNTFTIGFAGAGFADERPYAALAARKFGAVHQDLTVTAEQFRDALPTYVRHMEEPVCEPPAVNLYFLSRASRASSVKVLLSGEGGDEAFAGYPKYRNLMFLNSMKSVFGGENRLLARLLESVGTLARRNVQHYSSFLRLPIEAYYYGVSATPQSPFNVNKRALYTSGFSRSLNAIISDAPTRRHFSTVSGQSLLRQMLYVDTKTWLPDDLLIKADRMTMAASVELRVPMLDHEVLEFAASLPDSFKVRGRATKQILRMALRDVVPSPILKRRKAGFPIPYDHWLRVDLREFVNDTLLASSAAIYQYFEKSTVQRMLLSQQGGANRSATRAQHALDQSSEVFSLLVLELWHKEMLKSTLATSLSSDTSRPRLGATVPLR